MRVFVHHEQYGRFVSCLVFLPRDRYTTPVRLRDRRRAASRRSARRATSGTRASRASVLARLHFVLRVDPGVTSTATSTSPSSRQRVARPRASWADDLRDALVARRTARRTASTCSAPGAPPSPPRTRKTSRRPTRSSTSTTRGARRPRSAPALAVRLAATVDYLDLKLFGLGAQPSLSDVLPPPHQHGRERRRRAPVHGHAGSACRRAGSSGSGSAARRRPRPPAPYDHFEDDVPRGRSAARPKTTRSTHSCSRRAVVARGRGAARVQPLPPPGRARRSARTYVADHARRAPGARAPARRPVRATASIRARATRRRRDAAPIDARSPSSPPRSTRSRASTRTASCARCCASCSRRCARTGSRPASDGRRARASCSSSIPTGVPDLPLPRPMFEIFVYSPRVEGVHLRARAGSRAAASAGRIAARTSAPRCSAS